MALASSSCLCLLFVLHICPSSCLPTTLSGLPLDSDGLLLLDVLSLHLDPSEAGAGAISAPQSPAAEGMQGLHSLNDGGGSPEEVPLVSGSSSCDATYGVMPCTDTVIGNLFLVAVYGFLLFLAAKMMSDGSELLLTVLDAGLIGGLLLPILGALPDSFLILVSGLGGSTSEAQQQVLVGVGLLAGSTVMLLTLMWGICLIIGRCDLKPDKPAGRLRVVDMQLSKSFGLTETGIEVDELTQLSARIMIISVIPYIIAQLPRIFGFSSNGNIAILAACILALAGLFAYCLYQVLTPWLQQRRKEIAQKRVLKFLAIEKLTKQTEEQRLVDDKGKLNKEYAERLFSRIDRNNNGSISVDELRAMLSVVMIDREQNEDILNQLMEEFDEDENQQISKKEFFRGMQRWCSELKIKEKPIEDYRQDAERFKEDIESPETEHEDDDAHRKSTPSSKKKIIRKAVLLLLGGAIIAAVFADPLVDAVDAFSTATSIPSFFVSFVLLPIASNASEGVSSIIFSARKKKESFSITYSQIYGAATMNSTMGLGIFLAVVYARQLEWDFSSEVMIIIIVCLIMGLVGSFHRVLPLWLAGVALLLYPLSLCLVAVFDYVLGWQ